MRGFATFAAAAVCAATTAFAAPAVPSVNGVAADMTLDAARAAAPSVKWETKLSLHTRKPIAIWADAAFTLEGQRYRVSLQPLPSGSARLWLTSDEVVADAKICRARVVALAAHFDAFFEKMEPALSPLEEPPPASVTLNYNGLPGGAGYVTAMPNIVDDGRSFDSLRAGRNARIHEVEYDESENVEWKTGQRAQDDYPYALDLLASFHKGDAEPSTCSIEATVTRFPADRNWPGRPSFVLLDTATTKLVAKPSPAELHRSLDGVTLPAEGVSLTYRCDVDRVNGRVLYCSPRERKPAEALFERAARQRLQAMAFDASKLDPDNDLPLKADLTIKLSPSERLKEEPLAPTSPQLTPTVASGHLPVWTQSPTSADLDRFYPVEALRNEIEGRVVATCRITQDLSLACYNYEVDPAEQTMLEEAAKKILALYRAAPKLRDGSEAVGATVYIPIRFKLSE